MEPCVVGIKGNEGIGAVSRMRCHVIGKRENIWDAELMIHKPNQTQ